MSLTKTYAFVDESGDPSLNLSNDGTSSHFIVAVALVKGDQLASARATAQEIRSAHFGTGEMKSSGIGSDDARRLRVLHDLKTLPVTFYGFVVDKRNIWKDSGLIFKRPFLKFLSGKVYNRIFRTFPDLDVITDEHGSHEFMDGFRAYVRENHQPTLFDSSTFAFANSASEPLIQVADVVAGSLGKLFDVKRKSPDPGAILAALKGKIVCLEEWPPVYHDLSEKISTAVAEDHDGMVREYCKNQVALYLQKFADEEEDDEEPTRLREAVLTFLADQSRHSEIDRYISAGELLEHLKEMGLGDQGLYVFRSKIIGHFRDHGVIVASNSSGYKIPTQVSDIRDYVARCDAVIHPMVERLKQAREQIRMMSHDTLDIVGETRFAFLKAILEHQP